MAAEIQRHDIARSRAARACQRCSRRKVRCDATDIGLPCTRCRLDKENNCVWIQSRRGTYARKASRLTFSNHRASTPAGADPASYRRDHVDAHLRHANPSHDLSKDVPGTQQNVPSRLGILSGQHNDTLNAETAPVTLLDSMLHSHEINSSATGEFRGAKEPTISISSDTATSTPSTTYGHNSLAFMFEDFLDRQQGQTHEGVGGKCGIIFMSGTSPLTFALEELQRAEKTSLHDAGGHLTQDDDVNDLRNSHPSHQSSHDITYLKSKAAFDCPRPETLSALVAAFLDRFYPLYSIVDKTQFLELQEAQKLPWILLHAVCFIGATFCDTSVIHRAGFKSRWHARRFFYDKAKILFDVGYETNKIILLQTVLMLSFWGPQMKSYWNPCSWIGFGVTIAESLGIHRSTSSAHMACKDKGLLRRLWWTLAVRDAYCAALLGRPFRINIAQCDTEMLTLENFDHSTKCSEVNSEPDCHVHAQYQIQICKLSLVLRNIIELRFGPTNSATTVEDLHEMLNRWQAEMPAAVDWSRQSSPLGIFAASLKIIFNHHIIFIHLGKPNQTLDNIDPVASLDSTASSIVESAAQMISSTALTLMTSAMVGLMPHEIFPGFFVAGIVFYRQVRGTQTLLAQLGRASLDNCQMVMNEARECWDPAQWVMRIFDFLLSDANNTDTTPELSWQNSNASMISPGLSEIPRVADVSPAINTNASDILHSINLESPQNLDFSRTFHDFLLMPSYFVSTPDSW